MKIRIAKDLYVNSNTLFRVEWRKFYPVLVVHEKFEKVLKWILRIIAIGGIATSMIAIPVWYLSLGIALIIFLVEQFFEKAIIEYTTMIVQPYPDFEIDYGQWKTNGFMIPKEKDGKDLAYFGPSYEDKEYAIKIFEYFKSWIDNSSNDDKENNLILSLVIEPNEKYTTYIYANLGRKRLDKMFNFLGDKSKLKKFGKQQQQFIAQMFYWNTLDFKDGYFIKQFLEFQQKNKPFYFTPSVLQPFEQPPEFLFELAIKKYEIKIRKREDLKKNEPEYIFAPKKYEKETDNKPHSSKKPDIFKDIEKALSITEEVGFMPNSGNNAGAIFLCYSNPSTPYIAYTKLIENKGKSDMRVKLKEHDNLIDLTIIIENLNREINIRNKNFNKSQLDTFKSVNGGGPAIILLVGYPPAESHKVILEKEISPLILKWEFEE